MTISDHIEQDLQEKIRQDGLAQEKLTLAGLADDYEVSLTPVRVALNRLIQNNYIIKEPNGRLRVNSRRRAKSKLQKPSADPRIPVHNWDTIITEEVVRISLTGESTYLREESSAKRLGVGRTVIRQVFNRLAGSGLIEHVPRRGWQVHPFREKDMLDYIEMRETLELKALNLAKGKLDEEQLKTFLVANSPDSDGRPQLDNEIHEYLIQKSENRYLQAFFHRFGIYYSYLFSYSTVAISVIEEKAAEHRAILTALINKDWETASKRLRQHIRAQRPNVSQFFEKVAADSKRRALAN